MMALLNWARRLLGLRTYEEEVEAGRQYVRQQLAISRERVFTDALWCRCDPSFDYSPFDKGMQLELSDQGVPCPRDPWEA